MPTSANDPYALLARCLSTSKKHKNNKGLHHTIQRGAVEWGRLRYMANLHFCAPLWFVRLRQDGLMPLPR